MKNKSFRLKKTIAAVFFTAITLTGTLFAPVCAMAATSSGTDASEEVTEPGLVMSTSYPGIEVNPGDTATFTLDFSNADSGELVQLQSSGVPEGSDEYFQGSGNTISQVYVKHGISNELATYTLKLPDDLAEGTYPVTLTASGTNTSSTLNLTLTCTTGAVGASELTTDYKDQEGPSGTTFSYDVKIANNSGISQTYSLSAQTPDGWTATFKSTDDSATTIASVDIDGGSSETVGVTITPADNVEAGDYTIPIKATSSNDSLELDLTVKITGTYGMAVATSDNTLSFDAKANKQTAVTLNITNSGNIDLTNVALTTDASEDWTIEFSENSISSIGAGETKQVTMYVTPSSSAISGDYAITVTAKSEETSVASVFRVTVETQTVWGIVGVVIIAVIVVVLIAIFRKFGRH